MCDSILHYLFSFLVLLSLLFLLVRNEKVGFPNWIILVYIVVFLTFYQYYFFIAIVADWHFLVLEPWDISFVFTTLFTKVCLAFIAFLSVRYIKYCFPKSIFRCTFFANIYAAFHTILAFFWRIITCILMSAQNCQGCIMQFKRLLGPKEILVRYGSDQMLLLRAILLQLFLDVF